MAMAMCAEGGVRRGDGRPTTWLPSRAKKRKIALDSNVNAKFLYWLSACSTLLMSLEMADRAMKLLGLY